MCSAVPEHGDLRDPAGSRRLRVTQILEATTGGTRRHLFDLVTNLDPERFAVTVVGADRGDPGFAADVAVFRERGIPVTLTPMVRPIRPWADLRAFLQISRLLREQRPDVVHTHSSKAGFLGRLAARRAHVPRIVHTPHCFAFEMDSGAARRALYVRLERLAARCTDRMICVCAAELAAALKHRVAPEERLTVIENGVRAADAAVAPEHVEALRAELGLPLGAPVVGAVGRLTRQKGYEVLIRSAPAVLARFPDTRFVLVGDGELRAELERTAREAGVAPHVLFAGQREDTRAFYPLFDVLAVPSLWEALPYALLDGMASGSAVVASAVGGIPDVIHDGTSGWLVPPRQVPPLAEGIIALLATPELRRRLRVHAKSILERRCRLEDMIAKTEAVYAGG